MPQCQNNNFWKAWIYFNVIFQCLIFIFFILPGIFKSSFEWPNGLPTTSGRRFGHKTCGHFPHFSRQKVNAKQQKRAQSCPNFRFRKFRKRKYRRRKGSSGQSHKSGGTTPSCCQDWSRSNPTPSPSTTPNPPTPFYSYPPNVEPYHSQKIGWSSYLVVPYPS